MNKCCYLVILLFAILLPTSSFGFVFTVKGKIRSFDDKLVNILNIDSRSKKEVQLKLPRSCWPKSESLKVGQEKTCELSYQEFKSLNKKFVAKELKTASEKK